MKKRPHALIDASLLVALMSTMACSNEPDVETPTDAGLGRDSGSQDRSVFDNLAQDILSSDGISVDSSYPDTAQPDAAEPDTSHPDAAQPDASDPCQLPEITVFSPANGSELVLHGAVNAQGSNLAVLASDLSEGNGILARTWNGTGWNELVATPSYTEPTTPFSAPRVSEQAGQVLLVFYAEDAASGPHGHYARQETSDTFNEPTMIPGFANVIPTATQYFPVDDVLLVGGISDFSWDTLSLGELSSDGSWSTTSYGPVYNANTVGVGRLANGNPWVATTEFLGGAIRLSELVGAAWSPRSTLVDDGSGVNMEFGHVAGPPRGATGKGLVLWQHSDMALKGAQWNLATGAAEASTELLPAAGRIASAQVLYDQDNIGATFTVFEPNNGLVWLGRSESSRLGLFEPLRDDLFFEDAPTLLWSACGEILIVHHSRTLAQPSHSTAIEIEPLEEFRTR